MAHVLLRKRILSAAACYTGDSGLSGRTGWGDSRQNGGQGEELGGQVGQVDQQEDKERLDDPNLLGETSDEAQDDGEHQAHQSAPDADDEEGGCRARGGRRKVSDRRVRYA